MEANTNRFHTDLPNSPFDSASCIGRNLTYWWLADLLKLGLKRPIVNSDVYRNLKSHESKKLTDEFEVHWNREKLNKRPNLLKAFRQIYGKKIIAISLIYTILEVSKRAIQPQCLGGLLTHFASNRTAYHEFPSDDIAYIYAAGIIFCSILSIVINYPFVLYLVRLGMQIRIICCSMIYRQILKMTKSRIFDGFNGMVINLISSDVMPFDQSFQYIHLLWKGPLEAAVFGYLISREIGIYGWIGIGFILCFVPIQMWTGKMTAVFRLRTAKCTDKRVKVMNEIIQGIQVIKMYAWESAFGRYVDQLRKIELKNVRGSLFMRGILLTFNMASKIAIFLCLVTFVIFGNVFTARQVFIVTSYFNTLYDSMLHFWPLAISSWAECSVGLCRIEEFLLNGHQFDDKNTKKIVPIHGKGQINFGFDENDIYNERYTNYFKKSPNETYAEKYIIFDNCTAFWKSNNRKTKQGIQNIDLKLRASCAIIGGTGSGKSTLLQVILGEMEISNGQIVINGKISYAPQEPWLFEGTVRQNILFTESFDEARYTEVIRVCALERDLVLFSNGDATMIGEHGISLSGGQRARISLARAIYRKADIYLLDDPLSAVDTHVGKHIFKQCIQEFLNEKIVVLVTHQLQYLTHFKKIILMDVGHIVAQGQHSELQQHVSRLPKPIQMKKEDVPEAATQTAKGADDGDREIDNVPQQANTEANAIGTVKLSVYKGYFQSIGSVIPLIVMLLLLVIEQVAFGSLDLFVSQWVTWENDIRHSNEFANHSESNLRDVKSEASNQDQRMEKIYIYCGIVAVVMFLAVQKVFGFFYLCLRASRRLHNKLFTGITNAKMSFFGANASGLIMNRFAKDMSVIDVQLPFSLYYTLNYILQITSTTVLISMTNVWLIVLMVVLCAIFFGFRYIYIRSARCIKRIEATSRSPMFSHINATINGLSTIRAFNGQQALASEFDELQNFHISASFTFFALSRSLALWIDTICVLYLVIVLIVFFVCENQISTGSVGLAITQLLSLTTLSQWGVKQTAEFENNMTSVERVLEYSNISSECDSEIKANNALNDDTWPSRGAIEFKNMSLRYSDDGDFILHELNLKFESKAKIGIVGRTGAGKSSIIQALFRLAPYEGTIEIDGVDTLNVGLQDLRKKISVIPQNPILFSGTVRKNLDPSQEKSDDDLWKALEEVELKTIISKYGDGLDYIVSDGGSNFSMGQRQLICLARAIIRNNKILILDEATASVDGDTDKFVQTTIRKRFANCTVLTIAHRLHSVMDSDLIIVMEAGRVVECDHPNILLHKKDGFLSTHLKEMNLS